MCPHRWAGVKVQSEQLLEFENDTSTQGSCIGMRRASYHALFSLPCDTRVIHPPRPKKPRPRVTRLDLSFDFGPAFGWVLSHSSSLIYAVVAVSRS